MVCIRVGACVRSGTQYAGEMKKGVFTVMHYLLPKRGILTLHSGCNIGPHNDVTLFFGLSGACGSLRCVALAAMVGAAPWRTSSHRTVRVQLPTGATWQAGARTHLSRSCRASRARGTRR